MQKNFTDRALDFISEKFQLISVKSIFGSFLFAFALWCFANLNEVFTTYVQVPLKVNLPKNRAVESFIPSEINVEIKGTGWHLFNLIYFNNNKACNVNLSPSDFKDDYYNIPRSTIIKSLENFINVEAKEVMPEFLALKTGIVKESLVDIIPNVVIKPAKDYIIIGEVQVKPNQVKILGNENLIKNLKSIYTNKLVIEDVRKNISLSVPIADSIRSKYKLPFNNVEVSANIQRMAEVTFNDIPIRMDKSNIQFYDILQPSHLTVTLRGGINQIEKITPDMVSSYIENKTIISDTSGVIVPKIIFPNYLELVRIDPPFVYHYKKSFTSKSK